jgi:hypothetical protein
VQELARGRIVSIDLSHEKECQFAGKNRTVLGGPLEGERAFAWGDGVALVARAGLTKKGA